MPAIFSDLYRLPPNANAGAGAAEVATVTHTFVVQTFAP